MKFTRKDAEKFADLLIDNPEVTFKVMSDGVIYGERKDGLVKGVMRLGKFKNKIVPIKEEVELWNFNFIEMIESPYGENLSLKTYLRDYVYNIINQVVHIIRGRDVKPSGVERIDQYLTTETHWEHRAMIKDEISSNYIGNHSIALEGREGGTYEMLYREQKVDMKELQRLYQRLVEKEEESERVQKVDKGIKDYIESNKEKYEEEYRVYANNFSKLGKLWKWKVKEDGFYLGVEPDEVLVELRNMGKEIESNRKNNIIARKMDEIETYLKRELTNVRK